MHGALAPELIAIRVLLALVFIWAAAGKMRHWAAFEGVVANYRLLPQLAIRPWAYGLPPVEGVVGVGLLLPRAASWAATAAIALLVVFAVAMAANLLRGRRHIDCGCFQSALRQSLRWSLVLRNGVLAVLLGVAPDAGSALPDAWSAVSGSLGGVAAFVVLQSLNTLWAMSPVTGWAGAARRAHSEGGL